MLDEMQTTTLRNRTMREKPKTEAGKAAKVDKVMHEFGQGELHSGSKEGPEVSNPKQAVAIALSESGQAKKRPAATPHSFKASPANAHGYGHSGGQRAGHLRNSGHSGAHRLGKK